MTDSRDSTQGYVLALLSGALGGAKGIFAKALFTYQVDPLTVVALRVTVVAVTLLMLLALFRREWLAIDRKDWGFFARFGLIGVAGGFFLYFTSIDLNGVAIAAILLYTYPVFVTLLSAVFLDEQITASKAIAAALALAGVGLISGMQNRALSQLELRGVGVGLMTAVAVATNSVFGKKGVERYSSWTVLLYPMGFGTAFLLAAQFLFLGVPDLTQPPQFWGLILGLAWPSTLGAMLAYHYALTRIEASRAAVMATSEPVAATLLAYVVLQERLLPTQILGMALVLAGVVLVQR
jgi:drug/metabolite transporter (DMT)-like permease